MCRLTVRPFVSVAIPVELAVTLAICQAILRVIVLPLDQDLLSVVGEVVMEASGEDSWVGTDPHQHVTSVAGRIIMLGTVKLKL